MKLEGEGEAQKELEMAKGKAQAIEEVADAKAYEIEKLAENPEAYILLKQLEIESTRLERWDGSYPQFLLSGAREGDVPTLFMGMPKIDTAAVKAQPKRTASPETPATVEQSPAGNVDAGS